MKIRKGDTVLVISGPDKGAKGTVIEAYPTRDKVLVEGVNRIKKHVADSAQERGASSGGIVTQEAPIHVSNVMLVDEEGTPTRVGFRFDDEGNKVRISRRTGKDI
ncbi:50S ribosomal protein L24 [Corynebacterium sp. TAE3-ERU12]|uniref:50S ribosomal protein L24 n=1 Tax=Corynebacterium sp. TAE3-ERU12 TaxID=2849491 RepID=UPI001C45C3F2|nr:50S ribosomal protein L24 [Corynebacterium sp. TAE3-ERU12]